MGRTIHRYPLALIAGVTLAACHGFVHRPTSNSQRRHWTANTNEHFVTTTGRPTSSFPASASDGGEDDEDWRDFRAKLVMSHRENESEGPADSIPADNSTTATRTRDQSKTESSHHWAYESGDAIEVGSIILACPEQDFGYGLRQQYFHKCLVLVTYHDERSFTKGIILNRPTDLIFGDEDLCNADGSPLEDTRPGRKWRTMYGGEVKGLDSDDPEQTVLHCLASDAAKEVSTKVLNNLYWTTMAGARLLVTDGHAEPEDFIVYCGYAGWSAGQLSAELERGAWHVVTISGSLVGEVKRTVDTTHPERAGLDTWAMLMEKIDRKEDISKSEGRFDDLMLLEWAKHNLVFHDKVFAKKSVEEESIAIMERLSNLESIGPGTIIRSASPSDKDDEQPFLLDDQEFLESCILILQDDDAITVGAILNIPSSHSVDVDIDGVENDGETKKQAIAIPQRYGGRFGLKGQSTKPTIWLHSSESLKKAKVGSPLGDNESNFWCCSQNDVSTALAADGLATAQDFICINGFTVWEKSKEEGVIEGLLAEILYGKFDVVPSEWSEEVYEELIAQNESVLTTKNLDLQLELAQEAWKCAGGSTGGSTGGSATSNPTGKGTRANNDLAEMAKKSWWSTFLLGDPSLRFG